MAGGKKKQLLNSKKRQNFITKILCGKVVAAQNMERVYFNDFSLLAAKGDWPNGRN